MQVAIVVAALLLTACSKSNYLLAGRVQDTVAGHKVVVTDCYRTSVPEPEKMADSSWRWAPCRDAVILVRADQLEVNGRSYGKIDAADSILVDHGVVSVRRD